MASGREAMDLLNLLMLTSSVAYAMPDLTFGRLSTPGPDSSAQFRSAVLPRIFGGQEVNGPLIVNSPYGQRQKYYKPLSNHNRAGLNTLRNADCPKSPFTIYLNKSDQDELFNMVQNARSRKVDELSVKSMMIEFVRRKLDSKAFSQFELENREFEKQITLHSIGPGRNKRATEIRRAWKWLPKRHIIKNQRELFDIADGAKTVNELPLHRLPVV